MVKSLFVAMEAQLEIEKLQDLETQAKKSGEYEVLFDNLKQLQSSEEQKAKSNDSDNGETLADSSENPQGDVSGLSSSVSTDEASVPSYTSGDQGQSQDPSSDEDDGLSVAKEELRNLTFSLESFDDFDNSAPNKSGILGAATGAITGAITSAFMLAVTALAWLGITFGPAVLKAMFKGVIYVFGKLARLLYTSSVMLMKYIERRNKSFSNLKTSIGSLQKSIDLIKTKKAADLIDQQFTDQKVINTLKIGSNVDFTSNITKLIGFLDVTVRGLDRQISNDIGAINHLMSYSKHGATKLPDNILTVKSSIPNMIEGTVEGYQSNEELTQTYRYNEALPSDVVLIAVLPKDDLESLEQFTQAYNSSKLFLGMDIKSFEEVRSVDYMTLEQLSAFLSELDKLCDECIHHKSLYDRINVAKRHLKFGFKNYFNNLASADTKVSVKDSLVEYVYLKSMFVDKVYLVAAMDIHDYCAKVISYGLSYVEDHVKKLS